MVPAAGSPPHVWENHQTGDSSHHSQGPFTIRNPIFLSAPRVHNSRTIQEHSVLKPLVGGRRYIYIFFLVAFPAGAELENVCLELVILHLSDVFPTYMTYSLSPIRWIGPCLERFELSTPKSVVWCSIQLSYKH